LVLLVIIPVKVKIGGTILLRKNISIKVENLPPRISKLTSEELNNVFGGLGMAKLGERCDWECGCEGWPENVCGGTQNNPICVTMESELKKGFPL
jgi:hypothetical protein